MDELMPYIAVVDYGVGNIHSALKAVLRHTPAAILTSQPNVIENAAGIILPGVGAFSEGMRGVESRGLRQVIYKAAENSKPILGICLGAQILFEHGHEFGQRQGLGLVPGEVVKLPKERMSTKIPHIGWNKLIARADLSDTVLKDLNRDTFMYFVHSYIFKPRSCQVSLTDTEYGGVKFCSAFQYGSITGCQFHPEKSGEDGLRIIQNFVDLAFDH